MSVGEHRIESITKLSAESAIKRYYAMFGGKVSNVDLSGTDVLNKFNYTAVFSNTEIIAFGTVVIGGLGSMLGTFLGGIILGVLQTLGGYFFGPASQMLIVYVIILAILAIRPQGLFGR